MMSFRIAGALTAALFFLSLNLLPQEFRGTVSGLITDPSSAPVAGAKVTVIETRTGTKLETVSNSAGEYTAPFLAPGDYDIDVQAPGFKHSVHKAIHVRGGDHAVIDIPLQL